MAVAEAYFVSEMNVEAVCRLTEITPYISHQAAATLTTAAKKLETRVLKLR